MISGLGRRFIQSTIEGLNHNDRIAVWIPSYTACPTCGFDEVGGSAKDISCPTCNGTGRVVTWSRSYLTCRVAWTDVGRPRFGGMVTTGELGDATIEARLPFRGLLESVRDGENAYVEIDDRHLRVMSVDVNRIEGLTTVVARCEIIRHD